ncbi:MAG: hypothetical protein NZ561_04010, partial [Phycisphaerae bacterium]|nr:hypothetical protein [Phycisphaerae bacterium]
MTSREATWLLTGVLLAAAALRLTAARGGLWLDEIWSLELAREVSNPMQILTHLRIDNNHPLNTLVLWTIGMNAADFVYRLPVVALSTAAVALGWQWNRSRSVPAGAVTAGVLAISFPMIVYGSEARGYGYAAFFLLACLVCLERISKSPLFRVSYVVSAAGGILSHPTFLPALGAMMLWTIAKDGDRRAWLLTHAVPVSLAGLFWFVFVRPLNFGGSSSAPLVELAIETLSLPLGVSADQKLATLAAVASAGLTVAAIGALIWRGDRRWVLYLHGI